jgi:hypothetical protein
MSKRRSTKRTRRPANAIVKGTTINGVVTGAVTDPEGALASDETVINGPPFVMPRDTVAELSPFPDAYPTGRGPDPDDWLDETEALGKA